MKDRGWSYNAIPLNAVRFPPRIHDEGVIHRNHSHNVNALVFEDAIFLDIAR